MAEPSEAELKERIDVGMKSVIEEALKRPITDGTLDDIRIGLEAIHLKVIDMKRFPNHIDQRVHSRVLYEKNYYLGVCALLRKVCVENGFMVDLPLEIPQVPGLPPVQLPPKPGPEAEGLDPISLAPAVIPGVVFASGGFIEPNPGPWLTIGEQPSEQVRKDTREGDLQLPK